MENLINNFVEHHRTYTKINTLYKRDWTNKNKIILGDFARPEFNYLYNNLWSCEEKIDGTNVSVYFCPYTGEVIFYGKTENADIPSTLVKKMSEIFTIDKLYSLFPHKYEPDLIDDKPNPKAGEEIEYEVRLYGEGYGKGIQKGGNYIKDGVNVILFDVQVGNWWLERDNVLDVATKLNINICPLIGIMTLKEAEELVIKGFTSKIAENKDYIAEGLVCKPMVQLFNRSGSRVICKIKYKDYKNLNE